MSSEGEARVQEHLEAIARKLDSVLAEVAGERVLFALFTFGDGNPKSHGRFILNCEEAGAMLAIEKVIAEWKQRRRAH